MNLRPRTDHPVIGLQLTHSGRYCRPNVQHRNEPKILYHHPILDRRLGLTGRFSHADGLTDRRDHRRFSSRRGRRLRARLRFRRHQTLPRISWRTNFSARIRGREITAAASRISTRFIREIVEGIRSIAPRSGNRSAALGVRQRAVSAGSRSSAQRKSRRRSSGRTMTISFLTMGIWCRRGQSSRNGSREPFRFLLFFRNWAFGL